MNKFKNKINKDKKYFGAQDAMNLIDKTYNSSNYPIIEKTQNAYVMPLSMKRDVDAIDSTKFYSEINNNSK
ncbi:hypothetical protein SAMN02745883_01843 [Caminicella sporogenes DSM 14501]|uniref:Uncharacterized protein n=2 Tax=Caminicella TaxID=166484 RepID=A0A1M6RPY5_9FIRM|nr:hypothetical protein [Caminicella sporogenes]RKD23682.1 hypothetical protein BET04_04610 [Caminicella sporogenes]WIF94025.1 hypothetical protein QNI18_06800 [Caminicella sporogenes]SHK34503.1 hypothetical protein SAMN02745883_01843 [Caminicella sporogenes DSM 14501]